MTRQRVAAILLTATPEGEVEQRFEHVGLFAPLADRVAFERRFQMTATVLSRLSDAFYGDEDPEVLENPAIKGKLKPSADVGGIREEHVAFLIWRVLQRPNIARAAVGTFEEFLERVVEIDVGDVDEEPSELDPTAAAPLTVS